MLKKNKKKDGVFAVFFYLSSDVQCGHLVASILIVDLQYGHSFVVGFSGSAFFFFLGANSFFRTRNSTNAMIRKLTTAVMKLPYASTGTPASCASAIVAYPAPKS